MKLITLLINGIITTSVLFLISNKILNGKIFKNKLKLLISSILLCIYFIISYTITMSFVRYIIFLDILFICFTIIYNENKLKIWITAFFCWLLLFLSEFFVGIILVELLKIDVKTYTINVVVNLIINIICYLIFNIPKVNKKIKEIVMKNYSIKSRYSIVLLNIMVLSFSVVLYINYISLPTIIVKYLSLIVIFIYAIITIKLFEMLQDRQMIQIEYDNVNKNLAEYERMLDYQKMENHENKNQLLVIKGMIEKNDKKTTDYIDSIVKEHHMDNEEFLYKTNKIPSGGLRGLIYYKTLLMKEKGINIELEIDRNVKNLNFDKLNINLNKDLCKIVGVLIDNAIEAVENLNEKNIKICMRYTCNTFTIDISNNFSGILDIGSIDLKGYTTKGKGHGYGLSLVKEIIDNYENLNNLRTISNNIFTQKIYIKL